MQVDDGWSYMPAWLARHVKPQTGRAKPLRRRWRISFRLGAETHSHRITLLRFF